MDESTVAVVVSAVFAVHDDSENIDNIVEDALVLLAASGYGRGSMFGRRWCLRRNDLA